MAKKELVFEASVDVNNGAKSIKALRQEYKEAQSELNGLTVGTKEYISQLEKLGGIKDQIGDLNQEIAAFNPEGKVQAFGNVIGGLASGFQAAQGAAALFGAEGEELQKTLLKVQAASAFADGIKGIAGLKDQFIVLGNVIRANPIMLIASIIVGIGTALFALKDKIGIVGDAFDFLGKVIDTVLQAGKDFLDWIGLTTFAAEEQADAIVASAKKQQEALTQRYDDEIALAKAAGKNTFELEQKKQVAILQSAKTQIEALKSVAQAQGKWTEEQLTQLNELGKVIHDASLAIKVNNATNEKEITDNLKKQSEERKKIADEEYKKNFAAAQARADEINKEAAAYDAMIKKQKQQKKEAKEQAEKDAQDIVAQMMEQNQRELMASLELEAMKSDAMLSSKLALLEAQRDLELENTELTESEKKVIKEKYAQMESDLRTAQFNEQLNLTTQAIQATQALTDLAFDYQLRQAQGNAKKEREIKKKQFQVNKAFSVAQIILNTIMGITQAISSSPPPLSWVLAGINSAMGTAATIKALTTKFDDGGAVGGGGGGIPMGGSLGAAGSGANVAPPSTGSTLLNADGSIKKMQNDGAPTVKAIVTETDISSTQNRVNRIEETSKIK